MQKQGRSRWISTAIIAPWSRSFMCMVPRRLNPDRRQDRPQLHWTDRWRWVSVPLMLFTASMFMALAWLGHLKLEYLPFTSALLLCWLLVLPEYFLNVTAIRLGYPCYTGAQMASFRLCFGVICVALVSRFFLGEPLSYRQLIGFGIMVVAMVLITVKRARSPKSSQLQRRES